MSSDRSRSMSRAEKVKERRHDNDSGSNNLEFSLSGEENVLLDKETLTNVAAFIDKLHRAKRNSGGIDRKTSKECLSPRNRNASSFDASFQMDAGTKSSVGRIISVLSREEVELAAELSEVVNSVSFDEDLEATSVNRETLEAIGQYIDNAAKQNSFGRNDSVSLTHTSSHDTSKKKDSCINESSLESLVHSRVGDTRTEQTENVVDDQADGMDQVLQRDDISEGIEPDTLAEIGSYIDRTRSKTTTVRSLRSETNTSFTPQKSGNSVSDDEASQLVIEQSVSEDTLDRFDLPKETLETIGEYIDSVSLPPNGSASCYSGKRGTLARGVDSNHDEQRRSRCLVEDVVDDSREENAELLSQSIDSLDYRAAHVGASRNEFAGEKMDRLLFYEQVSRTDRGRSDAVVSPEREPPRAEKRGHATSLVKNSPTCNQGVGSGKDCVSNDVNDDRVHDSRAPDALLIDNYLSDCGNQLCREDMKEATEGKGYDDNTITTNGTFDVDPRLFDHFVEEIEALRAEEIGALTSMEALDEIFSEIDRSLLTESANSNLLAMIEDYVERFTAIHVGNDETTYDSSRVPEEARAVVSEFIDLVQKKKALGEKKVRDFESWLPEHLQKFRLKQPGVMSCPQDPPSDTPTASRRSDLHQIDPPIKMTFSEERRIYMKDQPETNSNIEREPRTRMGLIVRDPDQTSSGPLFDTTGELSKKTIARETPNDLLKMKNTKHQTPRNVTPSESMLGGMDLLLAPTEEKDDDSSQEDQNQPSSLPASPKLEISSNHDNVSIDAGTICEVIRQLARLLSPSADPSDDDVIALSHLIAYAYPHVNGRSAPASSVARIMCEAKDHKLDLNVADRFLNLAHAYFEAVGGGADVETVPSDELIAAKVSWRDSPRRGRSARKEELLDYVQRILMFGEQNPQFVPREEDDDDDVDLIITNDGDEEAIEIDLKDGFVNKEMALGATGEVPWWEIAARLSGGSSLGASDGIFTSESEKDDYRPFDAESGDGNHTDDENNQSNENFKKYWEERQNRLWKPFGYPSKTIEKNELAGTVEHRISDEWVTPSLSTAVSKDSLDEAWSRRQSMALWKEKGSSIWATAKKVGVLSVEDPRPINAVAATADMFMSGTFHQRMRKQLPLTKQWKRTYQDRTQDHNGFFGVHVYSLYDATCPVASQTQQDGMPWEYRIVKQRFLHEQSVSFRKNWFGVLLPKKGNPVSKNPVVRIQSMPMPIKASEWSEDWYQNPWVTYDPDDSPKGSPTLNHRSCFNSNVENSSLLEAPECGRIRNTWLKIGERVSRVTPDLTSSLRRSRWRKKHFPRGTFPY